MTDPLMLSKDRHEETPPDSEDDRGVSDYYYDDSTGYRIYKDDSEEDNEDNESDEE